MADVLVVSNGPCAVDSEDLKLLNLSGKELKIPKGEKIFVCRYGSSESNLFCDGTHRKVGFKHDPSGVGRPQTA